MELLEKLDNIKHRSILSKWFAAAYICNTATLKDGVKICFMEADLWRTVNFVKLPLQYFSGRLNKIHTHLVSLIETAICTTIVRTYPIFYYYHLGITRHLLIQFQKVNHKIYTYYKAMILLDIAMKLNDACSDGNRNGHQVLFDKLTELYSHDSETVTGKYSEEILEDKCSQLNYFDKAVRLLKLIKGRDSTANARILAALAKYYLNRSLAFQDGSAYYNTVYCKVHVYLAALHYGE